MYFHTHTTVGMHFQIQMVPITVFNQMSLPTVLKAYVGPK